MRPQNFARHVLVASSVFQGGYASQCRLHTNSLSSASNGGPSNSATTSQEYQGATSMTESTSSTTTAETNSASNTPTIEATSTLAASGTTSILQVSSVAVATHTTSTTESTTTTEAASSTDPIDTTTTSIDIATTSTLTAVPTPSVFYLRSSGTNDVKTDNTPWQQQKNTNGGVAVLYPPVGVPISNDFETVQLSLEANTNRLMVNDWYVYAQATANLYVGDVSKATSSAGFVTCDPFVADSKVHCQIENTSSSQFRVKPAGSGAYVIALTDPNESTDYLAFDFYALTSLTGST